MLIQEICSVMKNIIAALLLSTLSGCSTNSTEEKDEPELVIADTVYEKVNDTETDTARVIKNAPTIWSADFEEATNTYKIHKPANSMLDTLSAQNLVSLLNQDSIHVHFIKTSHDTMFISIPESEYLTQRIGSTGAENFMATTTFTLTEMKGIKYVSYEFTEGDHASPGVYSRKDFKNLQ